MISDRASIAQLVEHRSRKAGVIGSSPIAGSSCNVTPPFGEAFFVLRNPASVISSPLHRVLSLQRIRFHRPEQKLFDLLQFDGMDSPASTRLQKKSTPFQCVLRIFAGRRDLEGLANWGFVERGRRCARPIADHALKWRTFFSGRPSRGTGRRAGALLPLCVFCGSTSNCNKSKSFWLGMRRGGPVVPGGFLRRVS